MIKRIKKQCTPAKSAAVLMVFSDWAIVYPGALLVTDHPLCALLFVTALTIIIIRIEHMFANTFRTQNKDRWLLAIACIVTFWLTLILGAIGAGRAMSEVLLLRATDREAFVIWFVILAAKGLPLLLLVEEARAERRSAL